ncbi:MAG: glycosyltransferase family 4 protein [bacterium]|nr:glycosyltransferase family 4 protein [bacterium]
MKIAVVQPRVSYYVGGSEKVALKHAQLLSEIISNNEVSLYTTKPPEENYSFLYKDFLRLNKMVVVNEIHIPQKYRFIYEKLPGQDQNRWDKESILFSNLIRQQLSEMKPDVVLSYYVVDSLFKNLNVSNVVYLGGYPKDEVHIYEAFLTFCSATISNSENVKRLWGEQISRSGVRHNYVLPKGVDQGLECRDIFNKEDVNIVFAGRLLKRKGVDTLLEAFSSLTNKFPNSKLWILGDGPERKQLEEYGRRLHLDNKVCFTGFVSNVYNYFFSSTLCVFPFLYGEGLSSVVAEAMSVGACVISSSGDLGNEELISSGENGVLVPPGKVEELAKVMEGLISDEKTRRTLGVNAKKFASKNLSWETVRESLISILEETIKKNEK